MKIRDAIAEFQPLVVAPAVLECGGKRSATPLSPGREVFDDSRVYGAHESAVAAALCGRSKTRPSCPGRGELIHQ
jgi:hypothetical protein